MDRLSFLAQVSPISRLDLSPVAAVVTKTTRGRRRRVVPTIEPLRPTLGRLTNRKGVDDRLIVGPTGGVITTATLRGCNQLVLDLGLAGLVRHGLRQTALTWIADSGVPLYVLQRVAGHQDSAFTALSAPRIRPL